MWNCMVVSLLLSVCWVQLNLYLKKKKSWRPTDRLAWFLLAISQMGATLLLFTLTTEVMMDTVLLKSPQGNLVGMPMAVGALGWGAQLYGLRIFQGKLSAIVTGVGSVFLLFVFCSGDTLTNAFGFSIFWLFLALARFIQSFSSPRWLIAEQVPPGR